MSLKTYDTTGKTINHSKLNQEISDSGSIVNFAGAVSATNKFIVYGDSIADQTTLDNIVLNHEAVSLDEYKLNRIKDIDQRTQELISNGFPYDGEMFSLSEHAQLNWIGMKTADISDLLTFPMGITTIDDKEYLIQSKTSLTTFYITGLGYKKAILDSGRSLKTQIKTAVDVAGIDGVIDAR